MATIRKRGGKWQFQIRRQGSRNSLSFRLRGDALTWARVRSEAEMDRRGLPADPKALERVRLADILIRYRDNVVALKRSREVETRRPAQDRPLRTFCSRA